MKFKTIEFKVEAGVATLTLNRPDTLNSFNTQMHEEVRTATKHGAGGCIHPLPVTSDFR